MQEIAAAKILKEMLKEYYQQLDRAKHPQQKIAWCTSVGPAEILQAFGFQVYFPENHGALLGATRASNRYIPAAMAQGYSPDICSYLTSDIGAYLKGETPLTQAYGLSSPPQPDVLVYSLNQCREVQDWFLFYARQYQVPALGVFPPSCVDELTDSQIAYTENQYRHLIASLEEITGAKFDMDQFQKVVALSAQTSRLWGQFLSTAEHHPSPITFFDSCIHMAPAVMLRGTENGVAYYQLLNNEIQERVEQGRGAIAQEQVRLYWEGMPIWGKLRFFAELLEKFHSGVVASTYCNSWVFDRFSAEDPLRSLAEGYTQIFINRSESYKEKFLAQMVKRYQIDGLIFHDAKTCPHNTNCRFGLPQRLAKQLGIPYLIIHGDLNDLRCFSEDQTITAVESFIEQIREKQCISRA